MKKTLIALAALGMAAGAAQASNVTIYGQLQPSYDFVEVKETVSNDQGTSRYDEDITTMSNNNSRIGFKGSEDLATACKPSSSWKANSIWLMAVALSARVIPTLA